MTPTQLTLIALVQASNAVQAARDALAKLGLVDAAAALDNAGQSILFATGLVVKSEAERRRVSGTVPA